jgi:cytosine/uracil/thiamine/allantoin permease
VNGNEKILSGTIMTFLLIFGITMGSNFGILINELFIKTRV